MMTNPFDNLTDAKETERLPKLKVGLYDVAIDKCVLFNTQMQPGKPSILAFVSEFTVVGSNNPNQPPGSQSSYFRDMSYLEMARAELKPFFESIAGIRHGGDDREFAPYAGPIGLAAGDARNLLMGLRLGIEAYEKEVQVKKGPNAGQRKLVVNYRFSPSPSVQPQLSVMIQRIQQNPNPIALPPRAPQQPVAQPQQYAQHAQPQQFAQPAPQYAPQPQPAPQQMQYAPQAQPAPTQYAPAPQYAPPAPQPQAQPMQYAQPAPAQQFAPNPYGGTPTPVPQGYVLGLNGQYVKAAG